MRYEEVTRCSRAGQFCCHRSFAILSIHNTGTTLESLINYCFPFSSVYTIKAVFVQGYDYKIKAVFVQGYDYKIKAVFVQGYDCE